MLIVVLELYLAKYKGIIVAFIAWNSYPCTKPESWDGISRLQWKFYWKRHFEL
jgi:hypothetical protein